MSKKTERKKQLREEAERKRLGHRRTVLRVHKEVDHFVREALAEKGIQPTCQTACSGCCYQEISILRAEAEVIVEFVTEELTAQQVDALKGRIREYLEWTRRVLPKLQSDGIATLDAVLDHGPACPLLVDDLCSAYQVRPHQCRTHFVTSEVGRCVPRRFASFVDGDPALVDFGSPKHAITSPIQRNAGTPKAMIASSHRLAEWLAHLFRIELEPWRSTPRTGFAEAVSEAFPQGDAEDWG